MSSFRFLYLIISLLLTACACAQDSTYVIGGFAVEGNKKTKEWLILRECGYQSGDSIPFSELESAINNIEINVTNLQLFANVKVSSIPLPDQNLLILITVSERWYFFPIPVIQLAEPNFNVWWKNRKDSRTNYGLKLRQYNFRGRNERIAASVKFGYQREFKLAWNTPYLIKDKNWGVALSARYKENEEITVGTLDNERIFYAGNDSRTRVEQQYSIGVANRPNIYRTHSASLFYENITIRDSVRILFPDQLTYGKNEMKNLGLAYGMDLTRVDRKGYPRQGHAYSFAARKTGLGLLNSSTDVLDLTATVRGYKKLSDRWHSAHIVTGKSSFYNGLPYFSQRGLGYGRNAVRSYEFYIMDGQQYVLSRNNLSFNLLKERALPQPEIMDDYFPKVKLGLFLNLIGDLGYVEDRIYAEQNPLNNKLLLGTGLGLDLVTNYDFIFRFEYTVNHLGESGLFIHYRKAI